MVQFILVKDQKKIPIRRAGGWSRGGFGDSPALSTLMTFASLDLIKHVVKEYRNVYPEIMKRAEHTFGQVS